ncbi:hypothetical protein COV15_01530 [Candidatus Woesearchaeota archaeon CG10_big_fil_rev_8_21_14_0_10_34_12]|nr:MAG: hypothetical protein COV15_01530 [Candidatus Woesearchaeota archaeon CG10_big_fil_rev_8_21_14_0_10_34_12]
MEIKNEKENKLLNRKEITLVLSSEANPSAPEVAKQIAEKFKTEENKIAIKLIKGKFGRRTFLVKSFIYKSKEDKEKTEPKSKKKEGQQPAQAEQASEAAK